MARDAAKWLAIAALVTGLHASAWAQDDLDVGKSAYQSMCAMCHGADGKGKGPLSQQFDVAAVDLTVLAKKNDGVLPVSALYNVIDGRKAIAAHGTREMPVWGAYNAKPLYPSDKFVDFTHDPEVIVRTRILAIIDYLNRIQAK
jgi:mono/diheme cytochrome c family protein